MTALIVGTLLALTALSFVLYPMLVSAGESVTVPEARPMVSSDTNQAAAVDALREIEFDRATGKLSDFDYDSLKASYTQRALTAMRGEKGSVCENCGPRPETGALFCSNCGTALT